MNKNSDPDSTSTPISVTVILDGVEGLYFAAIAT